MCAWFERYDEAEEISPKQRETKAREMFVTVCNEIYSNAISTEITKGGALQLNGTNVTRIQYDLHGLNLMMAQEATLVVFDIFFIALCSLTKQS